MIRDHDSIDSSSIDSCFDVADPFTMAFEAQREDIDPLGHVNNKVYLVWMEKIGIGDTLERGFDWNKHQALGAVWVARRHVIDYLAPCFEGDAVVGATWPCHRTRTTQLRRYQFVRVRDRKLLVRAETSWIYVSIESRRPIPMPEEVLRAFAPMDDRPPLL